VSFVDSLLHYFTTVCRLRSSKKIKQSIKRLLLLSCSFLMALYFLCYWLQAVFVLRKWKKSTRIVEAIVWRSCLFAIEWRSCLFLFNGSYCVLNVAIVHWTACSPCCQGVYFTKIKKYIKKRRICKWKKLKKSFFWKKNKQINICWFCIYRSCFYVCSGSYFATISWRSYLVIDLCFLLRLLYTVLLKKENRFLLLVCESVDICSLLYSFPW